VQTDRWLVEHIQHSLQAGAQLGGQSDALGFTTGETVGGTVERQVAEPDAHEEVRAPANLGDEVAGDALLALVEADAGELLDEILNGQVRELAHAHAAEAHGLGRGSQAAALALRARAEREEALDHLASAALLLRAIERRQDAAIATLPLHGTLVASAAPAGRIRKALLARAAQDRAPPLLREVLPGRVEIEVVALADPCEELEVRAREEQGAAACSCDGERALANGEAGVAHDRRRRRLAQLPQAVAGRTRAVGRVE